MSKHTPGPWRQFEHNGNVMVCAGPSHLATVAIGGAMDESSDRANARLIAAAPELLDALRTILEYAECYDDAGPRAAGWQSAELRADIEAARAAIAKAEGAP